MTLLKLMLAFVRQKPLTWAFHALTLALGVAVVTAVLDLGQGLDSRFTRDLADINLVVGAKGAPMQLILSSIYQIEAPTGNIPLETAQALSRNMMVRRAVPISLGDNVGGLRIVGTSPAYGSIYGASLALGGWWGRPMEAVLGAEAGKRLGLRIGDTFVGDHGLSPGGETHKGSPYRVVGILRPTGAVIDRLVLTDIASVWKVHERENAEHAQALAAGQAVDPTDVDRSPSGREVTAVLVTYRSAMGALMLPRLLQAQPNLQTAAPAIETARLNQMLGTGAGVLSGFGAGLLALSALGFFVALFSAVSQRRRELALLRALGGGRGLLFGLVCLEALALGLIGGLAGWGLGRAAAAFAAARAAADGGLAIALPSPGLGDAALLAGALQLSVVAGLVPAIVAGRVQPAQTLRS
ncbi:ABC transporter permease [Caulobacter sp. LjRoot300]|uniref:ABC transporter permease n=1 Tax=Caulobacter sp. LjRoot300 TaxID=3342321 RepID=UPI003ECE8CE8